MVEDLIWLPTEREMFGVNGSSMASENATNQTRLAYYVDNASRIKGGVNGAAPYWEASASTVKGMFCRITATGTPSYSSGASGGTGIAPAFCLR
jgi:hypothetical protein